MKIHGMKQSPFNCHPLGWFFLAKVQYLSNAETEVAAHGLEGLANLLKTMVDNGLSSPDLGVRQNTRCHGIRRGLILRAWYLQAVVGKTDKFKRPLSGHLIMVFQKTNLRSQGQFVELA